MVANGVRELSNIFLCNHKNKEIYTDLEHLEGEEMMEVHFKEYCSFKNPRLSYLIISI